MKKPAGLLQAENTHVEKSVPDRHFFSAREFSLSEARTWKDSTEIYGRNFSARVCASENTHMENGPYTDFNAHCVLKFLK